ncbi:winged helix-turn-helix domain-containing protein [Teichococcus deserti]|nr:LysR family transcriptional regulator [Pseudoroseomonas deserti]
MVEAMAEARLSLRVDLGARRLGPGKVQLLEAIARDGSISAAARSLGMSYRRAWELVEDLNTTFGAPVAATATGGSKGGGARLTELGEAVVAQFRALEAAAAAAAAPHLAALLARLPAAAEED